MGFSRAAALCLLFGTTALSTVALSPAAHAQRANPLGGSALTPQGALQAPAAPAAFIREIRVEGTQRIEPATVRSYLLLQPGDPYEPKRADESLKSVYATGLFADVNLRFDGQVLVVSVVENPIINRIAFEGNKRVKTEDIEKETQLRPRVVYTRTRVQQDLQRILEIYRRGGRFAATIEPKIVQLEQNRVDLIFEIVEGDKTAVRQINFINNNVFDDGELRDVMLTKQTRWWRFLSSTDTYDPDRLNYDREQIRRFYLRNGYADFRIISSLAELTPDREDFFITITVDEGEKYKFGTIEIESDIKELNTDDLKIWIDAVQGDDYNADLIESSITKLTNRLGDLQYAFVEIDPELSRNQETHKVDVRFTIKESPRVFVERVDIQGNGRTLDKVIRREMLLAEGDPFSTSRLKRSEQRIKDLGFFEQDVKVTPAEGSQPDQSVITVEVSEQSTGEIQLGAGYSTSEGPLVDFSIRERNLMGTGQDLGFQTLISKYSKEFQLSYTEPYFMERDLAVGADVFHLLRNSRTDVTLSYDQQSTGIKVRAGYPLTEHLRQTIFYQAQRTKIENITDLASRFIREQQGAAFSSSFSQILVYDRRDSRLTPTAGYYIQLYNEFAGAGGSVRYLKNTIGAGQYYEIAKDWVLSLTAEAGYVFGLGQQVRIGDRFFLGGDNLRGFKDFGVGPRDLTNGANDALGGRRMERATLELRLPLGLPEELGIKAHAFSDVGSLANSGLRPLPGEDLRGEKDAVRASVGVGLSWKSPFGPIRIDIAYPLKKQSYDRTEIFRFNFGTQF